MLKKLPKNPAIKPKIVNAINKPMENAVVISIAFFLSLNANAKNAGNKAIPQGDVIEIKPAKNASKNVMLEANCCSCCLSFCNPTGNASCAKTIFDKSKVAVTKVTEIIAKKKFLSI